MPERPAHLVLVGMMGTGKTTVGRDVAAALGRAFVDVDAEVEAEAGRTVPAIFAAGGEPAFRRLEEEALARVLAGSDPAVVATGGGAVLEPGNRRALAPHLVVWLRARPETLAGRLAGDGGRPLLADGGDVDLLDRLRALAAERADLYAEVADHVVDVDGLDPAGAADAVRAAVAAGPGRARPTGDAASPGVPG